MSNTQRGADKASPTDTSRTADTTTPTTADLTAFQRDILWALKRTGPSKGLAVKAALEEYLRTDVNHGRLYPNLDTLAENGLIDKSERDLRTNEYSLTEEGKQALVDRQAWQRGEEVPA